MKSSPRAVFDLFESKRRYLVPLFQRQYVWSADKQWVPLWEDIERKYVERLRWKERLAAAAPGDDRAQVEQLPPPEHFLGAIVLELVRTYGNEVSAHNVIDGQQRLTTLQVFLAAFRDVAKALGDAEYTEDLMRLTRNTGVMADAPVERFKVWPTHEDQQAFRAVMDSGGLAALAEYDPDVLKKHSAGARRLCQAYAFFSFRVEDVLTRPVVSERLSYQPEQTARIQCLFETLQYDLQVVSIELEGRDDPQVIFETLNARGEPLLPSDLLRNYLFWRASREKADLAELYKTYRASFDTEFWKTEEKQGRLKRARVDLFFANLLQAKTSSEVNMGRLYYEYKEWSERVARYPNTRSELVEISRYAEQFAKLLKPGSEDALSRFVTMLNAFDVKTIFPLVMTLLADAKLPPEQLEGALTDLESYLIRRAVCGLTTKNYNVVFVGWLAKLARVTPITRTDLQAAMLELTGDASLWPDDKRFRTAWLSSPIYERLKPVGRIAYILKELELTERRALHEDVTIRSNLTVEHVLPQAWYEHWRLPDGSRGRTVDERLVNPSPASEGRDRALHTMGNLTLLTGKVNSGAQHYDIEKKVEQIEGYSLLVLNKYFHKFGKTRSWDEAEIATRGELLFNEALKLWPFPVS